MREQVKKWILAETDHTGTTFIDMKITISRYFYRGHISLGNYSANTCTHLIDDLVLGLNNFKKCSCLT